MLVQKADDRHHEAGRTETALQPVTFVKGLLHRMQRRARSRQSLDGRDFVALSLHGQHQARANRRAIEQDGAAAAHSVLAPDVRAGQAEVVADVVRQQPARIGRRGVVDTVDLHER